MKPRLPVLSPSSESGVVYVARRNQAYKIGFSRSLINRLNRLGDVELVLWFPVKQRPAQLEYLINNRFSDKRLPPQGTEPGDKREWFSLSRADLDWLSGLRDYLNQH